MPKSSTKVATKPRLSHEAELLLAFLRAAGPMTFMSDTESIVHARELARAGCIRLRAMQRRGLVIYRS
jgi:hypothetical protein